MEYPPQPSGLIAFIHTTAMQLMYFESYLKNPNIFYGVLVDVDLEDRVIFDLVDHLVM